MNGLDDIFCTFPDCEDCAIYGCEKRVEKRKPKRNYSVYYNNHSEQKKAYFREYYQKTKVDQNQYLKWTDVKKTINRLRKLIGENNYNLIMGEIESLERTKLERKRIDEVINTDSVLQCGKVH